MRHMTKTIYITEAQFAESVLQVLAAVEAGHDYVVMRAGVPIAQLSSVVDEVGPPQSEDGSVVRETRAIYRATRLDGSPEGALAQLVSAPATRKVLAGFLLEPTVELHQREVARRAGVGLRSAQLALKKLVGMGLLAERRDGNRLYYRAVRSERFEHTRALLAREFGIAEVIARHLMQLGKPVEWAFIFGSAARGGDRIGSDVDLFVVTDATDDELVAPIAEAQRELGRDIDLVSYRPKDFRSKRAEGNHFIQAILAGERFNVLGGDIDT